MVCALPAGLLELVLACLCCLCCVCWLVEGQATVQFSFCLVTSMDSQPSLALQQWSSVTSGILDTATPAAAYTASGSYLVTALLNASFYGAASHQPSAASLLPLGAYAFNDNLISISSGSEAAGTDEDGLSWLADDVTFNVWNDGKVECAHSYGLCGSVASFTVRRYFTGGAVLPCARSLPQFSFCLITGNHSAPDLLVGGYSSYMSGVMTAASPAFPFVSTASASYYPSGKFAIANISQGFYAAAPSSGSAEVNARPNSSLSLMPAGFWGHNDNHITFTDEQLGLDAIPTGVTFDTGGMTLASGGGVLRVFDGGRAVCQAPAVCGPFHSFTAALLTSKSPAIPCGPLVQFSFCFITGNVSQPSLQRGHYSTILSGILNSNVVGYSGSASYPIVSMQAGLFWNSSSPEAQTATLLQPNSFADNDNVLILRGGSETGGTDGSGLSFAAFTIDAINIYSDSKVECTYPSKCGTHGLLQVRRYTGGSGVLPCGPPASSSSALPAARAAASSSRKPSSSSTSALRGVTSSISGGGRG